MRSAILAIGLLSGLCASAAPVKTALYVDDGCRGGGLLRWATILRESPDVDLKLVSGADIRSGALDDRALLVMPGGTGREQYGALGDAGAQRIRDFVAAGGSYFGTCCGIAIALNEETSYAKRLKMLPLKRVKGPVRGGFTANVRFNRRGAEWLGIREGDWKISYHNGPIVEPTEPVPLGSDFEVLATMNCELMQVGAAATPMFGTPAAVRAKYGKGQMFALNCHPEAMPKTREIVIAGIRALTGTTIRLKPMKRRAKGAESVGFFASELGCKSSVEEYFRLYDDPAVDVTPVTRDMLETDSTLHFDRLVRPWTPKVPRAEFAKYVKAVTGRDAPAARFELDPSLDAAHDEYRIVSDGASVAFFGANGRAVLYAVYDFLSRRGGCRWFWDGDVVPKAETINYAGLDVREKSRFEYRGMRYFAHRGLTRFQAEHWGLKEWKQEIDWCVKNRLNLIMPRIGMDDTWQKAYPDVVPYPDPAKPLPEAIKGYNNRSLFWPLEYRGELRRQFTAYAKERGLMVPTDSGTLTHWYSRTPLAFLEKENPPFIKQATNLYGEKTGLVFDVTEEKWMDKYWRLSEAAIANGYGDADLLHTVALGERMISTNRAENLAYKTAHLKRMFSYLHRKAPEAKLLFAGWDLYNTWLPSEVRSLIPQLDPKTTLIWDYEADSTEGVGAKDPDAQRNFTRWDLVGRFPYTFGVFLAYEQALDIRANYPLIAEREKVAAADPMCKGYILWPESSHTDILLLRYFAANSWRPGQSVDTLLPAFCRDRYGEDAAAYEAAWRKVIPVAHTMNWWGNYATRMFEGLLNPPDDRLVEDGFAEILSEIAKLPQRTDFERRDAMDLARTVADRLTEARRQKLVAIYAAWRDGAKVNSGEIISAAERFAASAAAMADLLELHTDYSLYESMERLNATEPIRLPGFDHVLVDNAANWYCRSHQYEAARNYYAPFAKSIAASVRARVADGDRGAPDTAGLRKAGEDLYAELLKRPLAEMRPTAARTEENFKAALLRLANLKD